MIAASTLLLRFRTLLFNLSSAASKYWRQRPVGHDILRRIQPWPWLEITVGLSVLLISWAHISGSTDALNYFDPPKRLLWAGVILVAACGVVFRPHQEWRSRVPLWPALLLLVWLTARTFFKPHPMAEFGVLCGWLLPPLLFLLAGSLNSPRPGRLFGGFLVAAALVQSGVMVLQRLGYDPFFLDVTSAFDYKPGRMIGTIGYQNQAVDFLAISSVGIFLLTRSFVLRFAYLAIILLIAGLAGNRGGILALTIATLLAFVLLARRSSVHMARKKVTVAFWGALGLCGVLALLALVPETFSRFAGLFETGLHSSSVASRVVMAGVCKTMILEKPIAGWGGGEFAYQYIDRLGAVLPDPKSHEVLRSLVFAREAHNDLLQFVAEFGLLGLLVLLAFFVVVTWRVARAYKREPDDATMTFFVLSYISVSALFSFPWQTSTGGPMAGFVLGLLWPTSAVSRQQGTQSSLRVLFAGVMGKSILSLVSLLVVGWYALDAFFNTGIPAVISSYGPKTAQHLLPGFAYRYHAVVGGVFATHEQYAVADAELTHAYRGYVDIPLLNNLGHVKAKQGKWQQALDVYARWSRSGLDHRNALMNLSIAHEQIGQFKQAATALSRREVLFHDLPTSEIKRLAVLQLRAGDAASARSTLDATRRRWSSSEPESVAQIENLYGAICLSLGQKQEAANWFRDALNRNPKLDSARRNLLLLERNLSPSAATNQPH